MTDQTTTNETNDPTLSDQITALQTELETEREKKLIALADLENFKRRIQKEREEMNLLANSATLNILLEIMDDLARSLSELDTVPEGLSMISDKVKSTLANYGVEEIAITEGDPLDPKTMEAIGTIAAPTADQDKKVLHIERKGYKLKSKDQVVRTARVIVGKFEQKV